MIENLSLHSES